MLLVEVVVVDVDLENSFKMCAVESQSACNQIEKGTHTLKLQKHFSNYSSQLIQAIELRFQFAHLWE